MSRFQADEVVRYRADLLAVAQHRDRLECERHDAITERDELAAELAEVRRTLERVERRERVARFRRKRGRA